MNNKVNYTAVGLFVLGAMVMLFAFGYWMLKPSDDEQMKKYLIYFNESVFGLNVDAPVKFRGISVGKVIDLKINKKNTQQVEVLVEIRKTTPINETTVAKLTAQGITGLTYINLTQTKHSAPRLHRKKGELYPVIASVPSFFENIENSIGNLNVELLKTLQETQKLLSEQNRKELLRLLKTSGDVMQKIDRLIDDKTIANMHKTAQSVAAITAKLDTLLPNINKMVENTIKWEDGIDSSFISIKDTYISMDAKMQSMAQSFSEAKNSFESLSVALQNTLQQSEYLMIDTSSTLESLQKSPSDLLYKKTKERLGPGEER